MTADNLTQNAFGNDLRANSTSFDCGQRPTDCQLSVSPPPELRVCFSKIRLLSWLKKDVGDHLDKLAKMERVDRLEEFIREKARVVCTKQEFNSTGLYLLHHQSALQAARDFIDGLSNYEKDQMNVWQNLGDISSQQKFYEQKFQELPEEAQSKMRRSFVEIMFFLTNAAISPSVAKFLQLFSAKELADLKAAIEQKDMQRIAHLYNGKFRQIQFEDSEREEIQQFLQEAASA